MDIPVKRWYEAVQNRYSQQKYMAKEIKEFTLRSLGNKVEKLNKIYPEVRIEILPNSIKEILPALKGKYGNFTESPAFIAFIINDKGEHRWTKMGYIGEATILEATALGLGTCWIAGRYLEGKSDFNIDLKRGERLVAVSPLGYSSESYNLTRHFISKLFPHRDRKNVKELCPDGYDPDWPSWVKNAIKIASYAPSRLNRQPWRFYYGENKLLLDSVGEPSSYKRLECGISLLHLEVGALDSGAEGKIKFGGLGLASFIKNR
ncbi:MAG: nitroreductase family protein [Bacillota bacterium]